MKIGSIQLQNKTMLAPMAKVTTLPFRLLCKKYGCGLVFSEMVNANALVRNNKATMRKAKTIDRESPVAVQLFGTNEATLLKAGKILNCDIININMGCPDHSVMGQGAGAALLKRPAKIRKMIHALSTKQEKPVTAKIRIGLDQDKINAVQIAQEAESGGAAAIIIHARTVAQKYSGNADWSYIAVVKKSVSIPVVANGDIRDEISAKECLEKTGADFLMIGRAAIGEPYIFKRINHYLETGRLLPKQTRKEKIADFFEYISLAKEYDCVTFSEVKTHAQWFTKSLEGGGQIRKKITYTKSVEEIEKILNKFLKSE